MKQVISDTEEPNRLQKMGIAYIHFALKHPVHFQLMFGAFLEKTDYPSLKKASTEAYQLLHSQVEQNIQEKKIAGNVDGITRTAWATVHGAAVLLLDKQFGVEKDFVVKNDQIALEITSVLTDLFGTQ